MGRLLSVSIPDDLASQIESLTESSGRIRFTIKHLREVQALLSEIPTGT